MTAKSTSVQISHGNDSKLLDHVNKFLKCNSEYQCVSMQCLVKNTSFRIQPFLAKKEINLSCKSEPYPPQVFNLLSLLVGITVPQKNSSHISKPNCAWRSISGASSCKFELSLPIFDCSLC